MCPFNENLGSMDCDRRGKYLLLLSLTTAIHIMAAIMAGMLYSRRFAVSSSPMSLSDDRRSVVALRSESEEEEEEASSFSASSRDV